MRQVDTVLTLEVKKKGKVEGKFTSDYHTATMVPIFAYGPGAESFTGVMDNTEIFHKLKYD